MSNRESAIYNEMLIDLDLVSWTSGNVSISDGKNLYIKPSGILFKDIHSNNIATVNIETGEHTRGLKPSTDTESHRVIYKNKPEIRSIVHTHSTFATAFAACGKNIPVYLTAMADEFGEEIPCSGYAEIGGKEIGEEVCKYADPTGIVLLRNHGVFTIGTSAKSAMKKAVMVEDIAKTTYYAIKLSETQFSLLPHPVTLTEKQIKSCYDRYQGTYGQNSTNR